MLRDQSFVSKKADSRFTLQKNGIKVKHQFLAHGKHTPSKIQKPAI
jgi:hypothetical protein